MSEQAPEPPKMPKGWPTAADWAELRKQLREAFRKMDAAMAAARVSGANPATREARSRRRLLARYENQRQIGLAYVKDYAAQVRQEMGLPPE